VLAAAPNAPPPITPLTRINILDASGRPLQNDNATSFAYFSSTGSVDDPAAMYIAYRPQNPSDATPIQPGEALQLLHQLTGKYCRLADLPAGLVSPPQVVAQDASLRLQARRLALACIAQGLICDQDSVVTATVLTFTGTGLAFNGVPLMVMPPSNTLVLSSDPSCASPGSSQLTFRPVSRRGWLSLHLAAYILFHAAMMLP
jgi:hypothetical protein